MRTRAMLDALAGRFDTHVLSFSEDGRPRPRSRYSALAGALATHQPYQVARWSTHGMRHAFDHHVRAFRPDAVHIEYSQFGRIGLSFDGPKALDMHNVESAFAAEAALHARGVSRWIARRDARLFAPLERQLIESCDLVIVSSESEAERAPGPVSVVPNGVSLELPAVPYSDSRPNHICFTGLFSWLPNVEGAEWLVREVMPRLPDDVTLELVGRNPDRRVRELAGPGVMVTGEVPSVRPYLAGASVALAPLLARGGTRLKILEGLAVGRPVVATREAADGLEDLDGRGLTITSGSDGFASAVTRLLADPTSAAEQGALGRQSVSDSYGWKAIGGRLLGLYEERLRLA